jgi:hypothetical protein
LGHFWATFWVKICFVVDILRVQERLDVDVLSFDEDILTFFVLATVLATILATFSKIWANFFPNFWSPYKEPCLTLRRSALPQILDLEENCCN